MFGGDKGKRNAARQEYPQFVYVLVIALTALKVVLLVVAVIMAVAATGGILLLVAAGYLLVVLIWIIIDDWYSLGAALRQVGEDIADSFKYSLGWIKDMFLGVVDDIYDAWIGLNEDIVDGLWEFGNDIMAPFQPLIRLFDRIEEKIEKILKDSGRVGEVIENFGTGENAKGVGRFLGLDEFATGGVVPGISGEPRLILAHGGEEVLTEEERNSRGKTVVINTSDTINIPLYISKAMTDSEIQALSTQLARLIVDEKRRAIGNALQEGI